MTRAVLEFMPGVGWNNDDVTSSNTLQLAVNNNFNIALENHEDFFIGMAVFVSTLARRTGHDKKETLAP